MNTSRRQILLTGLVSLASAPALANYSYETPAEKIARDFIKKFQSKIDLSKVNQIKIFNRRYINANNVGLFGVATAMKPEYKRSEMIIWEQSQYSIYEVLKEISYQLDKDFISMFGYTAEHHFFKLTLFKRTFV